MQTRWYNIIHIMVQRCSNVFILYIGNIDRYSCTIDYSNKIAIDQLTESKIFFLTKGVNKYSCNKLSKKINSISIFQYIIRYIWHSYMLVIFLTYSSFSLRNCHHLSLVLSQTNWLPHHTYKNLACFVIVFIPRVTQLNWLKSDPTCIKQISKNKLLNARVLQSHSFNSM